MKLFKLWKPMWWQSVRLSFSKQLLIYRIIMFPSNKITINPIFRNDYQFVYIQSQKYRILSSQQRNKDHMIIHLLPFLMHKLVLNITLDLRMDRQANYNQTNSSMKLECLTKQLNELQSGKENKIIFYLDLNLEELLAIIMPRTMNFNLLSVD